MEASCVIYELSTSSKHAPSRHKFQLTISTHAHTHTYIHMHSCTYIQLLTYIKCPHGQINTCQGARTLNLNSNPNAEQTHTHTQYTHSHTVHTLYTHITIAEGSYRSKSSRCKLICSTNLIGNQSKINRTIGQTCSTCHGQSAGLCRTVRIIM